MAKSVKGGKPKFQSPAKAGRYADAMRKRSKNKRKAVAVARKHKDKHISDVPAKAKAKVDKVRRKKRGLPTKASKAAKSRFSKLSGKEKRAAFLRMQAEGSLRKKDKSGKRTRKQTVSRAKTKIKNTGIDW